MDVHKILNELYEERQLFDEAIAALGRSGVAPQPTIVTRAHRIAGV
ncbi:MAG: hypothetical protein ACE1Z8_10520 [Candidatus Acidiferrales bacterium]